MRCWLGELVKCKNRWKEIRWRKGVSVAVWWREIRWCQGINRCSVDRGNGWGASAVVRVLAGQIAWC